MRRAALCIASAALLGGCSFVYDFGAFHPADAAVPVDAAELGVDDGPSDAALDAGLDAELDAEVPLTPELFAARLRELACAKTLRCTNKLVLADVVQILCHEDVGPELLARQFLGDVGIPTFDPFAAQRCLDALAVTDCSLGNQFLSECEEALRGDAADGAPCQTNYDCASDACVEQAAACGRICEARGSVGVACTENRQCEPLLRCRGGLCAVPGAVDDPCDETSDCGFALWCPRTSSACTVVPNLDEPCELDLSGDPCIGSLVCTPFGVGPERVCVVGGDADAICDVDHPCRPGFRCSSRTAAGVCVPLSGPGGPCDSAQNCPFLYECVANICVSYPTLGEACSAAMPCVRGACTAGRCTLQPAGTPCTGENGLVGAECEGYCQAGATPMCVDLLAPDGRCVEDAECMPGSECLGAPASAVCTACTAP